MRVNRVPETSLLEWERTYHSFSCAHNFSGQHACACVSQVPRIVFSAPKRQCLGERVHCQSAEPEIVCIRERKHVFYLAYNAVALCSSPVLL